MRRSHEAPCRQWRVLSHPWVLERPRAKKPGRFLRIWFGSKRVYIARDCRGGSNGGSWDQYHFAAGESLTVVGGSAEAGGLSSIGRMIARMMMSPTPPVRSWVV